MTGFRRRRGERINYTPQQSVRYFSQRTRWLKGSRMSADAGIEVIRRTDPDGDPVFIQYLRFRTQRSPTGYWEVKLQPFENGSGGGGSGGGGSEEEDPNYPPGDYWLLVGTAGSYGEGFPINQTPRYAERAVVPFYDGTDPDVPWSPLLSGTLPPDLQALVIRRLNFRFSTGFKTEGTGQDFSIVGEVYFTTVTDAQFVAREYPPSPCQGPEVIEIGTPLPPGCSAFLGPITIVDAVPFTVLLGGPGEGGGGGGPGGTRFPGFPYEMFCNCPDIVESEQPYLSPFPSTQQGRDWSASNTGSRIDLCKHMYASMRLSGYPAPDPAIRVPEPPQIDRFTPPAEDDEFYRELIGDIRQRRRTQRAEQVQQRRDRRNQINQDLNSLIAEASDDLGIVYTDGQVRFLRMEYNTMRDNYDRYTAEGNASAADSYLSAIADFEQLVTRGYWYAN